MWGTGKALRGKDGSMDQAVDGMHNERAFIFSCFGVGLITTLLALMSAGVWPSHLAIRLTSQSY